MLWFDGSIAEAVNLSKQRNAIFVVFVEGDNDLSTEMTTTLNNSVIVKRLADQSSFLAIKLKSGSTNYTHFAQIYQFVPVPSLFFIGRNGTPLEVVCAGIEADNLAKRIDRILEEHQNNSHPTAQPSTSGQSVKEQTANLLQSEAASSVPAASNAVKLPHSDDKPETSSGPPKRQKTEHHEVTKSGQEYDVVCDGDVCVRKPKVSADDAGSSHQAESPVKDMEETKQIEPQETDGSVEEKMQRAKELIEARRREKEEKEKEAEKQKELERRAMGQGVAELKRWQQEQELKQIQEERKREKMENNLARQRILEQIAQDRAERRARDIPQTSQVQEAPVPQTSGGDGSGGARIQFKLPDGTSHTAHFEADNTLEHVRRYLTEKLKLSDFSLWMAFPRRELTENDATLRQLQIAPSAALLVMPRHTASHNTVVTPSMVSNILSFISQFFSTFVFDPAQQLYDWIRARLFPPSNPTNPSTPGNNPRDQSPAPRVPPQAQTVRRRGNIHRLPGERPADDDNNTWNGNSTQQM